MGDQSSSTQTLEPGKSATRGTERLSIPLALPPVPAAAPLTFPLSFAEQRLWFLDKLEPGLSIYNVPEAIRLKGPLDIAALERGVNEIIRRHEALRTTFREIGGEPVQLVPPFLHLKVTVEDLTNLPVLDREQEALRRASDHANRPFNLQRGPLLRVLVLRVAAQEHVVLINIHHIVSEGGWSMGLFLRELNECYTAYSEGRPSPLSDLEIQYGDYATWQREWMQGEVRERLLAYWKAQLEGAPALLEFPTDYPRPRVQTYAGARESFRLPASLKQALQRLSNRESVTLFTTLLAALKTLLTRYTRQEDIVVGAPSAGRNSPETHNLIGFFVNTLALRTDLSGDPTFRELLQRVRKVLTGAQAHDEVPFELVVEALKPERSLAYSPVFQVMFAYQNAPRDPLALGDLEASPVNLDIRTSMFDLRLFAWDKSDDIELALEYSTDLFSQATIRRMLNHFQTLLEGAVAQPDTRISRLPLLSLEEEDQVLRVWNKVEADVPVSRCIHELFEDQARKTPDAVAVVFEAASLTYAELNARANRLAHYLRGLGVKPDARVAICLERSLEMVIALLAVLKAGGAYVPLDPAYPVDRLRHMLDDSAPVALVTQASLLELFGERDKSLPVLDMASGALPWREQPDSNPDTTSVGLKPSHVAYVIYTSGSTGAPKGVMVEHGNVVRLFTATDPWFHFNEKDVWTLFHSFAFDFSVWEIWGPFFYGGRLIVVPKDTARSTEDFYKLVSKAGVTVLNQTPSAFRQFIAAQARSRETHRLRYVIFGGEALEVAMLKPWYEQNQDRTLLVNMYGITETTVHVTYRPLEAADTDRRGASPIGCRIPDLRTYILDDQRQPVPVGVTGELYVGGAGVARGYLNRADLTAQRFLKDPFVNDGAARMYKTGDLGRWLADGSIDFLGRNDFQVKIRGFRIELGEIEARLLEQPGIREAVVIAREDAGDKRLVAYYTTPTGGELDTEALRAGLAKKIPEYMLPAAFMRLDSLPLTQNGKLDRKALPAPVLTHSARHEFVASQNAYQARLTRIWEDVLKVSPIGIRDNYFDLGGHSLLAVKLFWEIEKAFGIELPLASLYRAPTVESLAALLATNGEAELWSALVPIRRTGTRPPFYFVSGVGGGVLVFRDLAVLLGEDQPVYALQPKRPGENETYPTSIAGMAAQYIQEIRAEQPHGPYYLGGYSLGGFIAFEMAQQLVAAGEKIAFLGLFDANAPLRIAKSKLALIPQRNTRSLPVRIYELVRSNDLIGGIKRKAEKRRVWLNEKMARLLRRPLPEELQTLVGSQGYAGHNYVGRPYSGTVTLFRSIDRPDNDPWTYQLGWENLTSAVEVHDVPGDHLTIYSGGNISILSDKLRACLDNAQAVNSADPNVTTRNAESDLVASR